MVMECGYYAEEFQCKNLTGRPVGWIWEAAMSQSALDRIARKKEKEKEKDKAS